MTKFVKNLLAKGKKGSETTQFNIDSNTTAESNDSNVSVDQWKCR
jgi:hypothetical protein